MISCRAIATSMLLLFVTSCSSANLQPTIKPVPPPRQSTMQPPTVSKPRTTPLARDATAQREFTLPAGVQLSDIHIKGRDLVINLPDGTQMLIPNGAVFVPGLVIGDVQLSANHVAALVVRGRPVSTRLFVPPHFEDFKRYGAVAMIAFPQVAGSAEELKRYRRICEAYLTTLPDAVVTGEDTPDSRQMVTIWPRRDITKPRSVDVATPGAAATECVRAVRNYDYAAAAAWLRDVPGRAGLNRVSPGPFLVAWAPPSAIAKPQSVVLLFDLSDFDLTSEIERAFRVWKEAIEEDPPLWEKGWNVEWWKARTAAKLDRYGKQIASALALVPWLK